MQSLREVFTPVIALFAALSMSFHILVRTNSQEFSISTLTANSTVNDLFTSLEALCDLSQHTIIHGFSFPNPPNHTDSLASLNITSGHVLVLHRLNKTRQDKDEDNVCIVSNQQKNESNNEEKVQTDTATIIDVAVKFDKSCCISTSEKLPVIDKGKIENQIKEAAARTEVVDEIDTCFSGEKMISIYDSANSEQKRVNFKEPLDVKVSTHDMPLSSSSLEPAPSSSVTSLGPVFYYEALSHLDANSKQKTFDTATASAAVIASETDSTYESCSTCNSQPPLRPPLRRHSVPTNSSSLFTSIVYALEGANSERHYAEQLRELIAGIVEADPSEFNSAVLGKSNKSYLEWIRDPKSWGGSLEIGILARYYAVEICVIDARTGLVNRFGEDSNYSERIFLFYNGLHYEPIIVETGDPDVPIRSIFPTTDEPLLSDAKALAVQWKVTLDSTQISKVQLTCVICHLSLRGEAEAEEHARETGHHKFVECM